MSEETETLISSSETAPTGISQSEEVTTPSVESDLWKQPAIKVADNSGLQGRPMPMPPPLVLRTADDALSVVSSVSSRHMELKKVEQEIDRNVFHSLSKRKQKRFKRTVMSIHAIVTHKLYKAKSSSLELYFKDSWNISRAQVYRFLDSAWVLKVSVFDT